MDLKGILSISGYGGLFKLVSQTQKGIVVENLTSKKRMMAYATNKISALEDIAIFTESKDVQLADVFKAIYDKEEGKESISHKSGNDALKVYFAEILPDYDRQRVYVSDMKRVINWYNILQKEGLVVFEDEETTEDSTQTPEDAADESNTDEN